MHIGVIFPQGELELDAAGIREYACAVEDLGYHHILLFDHVVGTAAGKLDYVPRTQYTHESAFQEIFVLLGYLAAVTTRIELTTGVVVLPQRQTALTAKQAAQVDILAGGRFRFGVGAGWNPVEYDALGMDFRTRGKRLDEQVRLLRLLWTRPIVDFEGDYHSFHKVGINPLPMQRPIPIWFGGDAPQALQRMARLGDGWICRLTSGRDQVLRIQEQVFKVHDLMRQLGRDPREFGLEGHLRLDKSPDDLEIEIECWRAIGATHLALRTTGMGLTSLKQHIEALEKARPLSPTS